MQQMILGTIQAAQQLPNPNGAGPSNVSYIGTNDGDRLEGSTPGLATASFVTRVDIPRLTKDKKGKAPVCNIEDFYMQTRARDYQDKVPRKMMSENKPDTLVPEMPTTASPPLILGLRGIPELERARQTYSKERRQKISEEERQNGPIVGSCP
ncbi:hypothetical protein R1flu_016099 [Riccia fluitans]|uniref:Uncharacterized protein n=1 Tax=Riccia fluitans TaxID=41844 RepID=A0ABD1YKV3_9MARC